MKKETQRRIRRTAKRLPGDVIKLAVILCFVFPFYWMFCTAFKTYGEAISIPVTFWPKTFSMEGISSIINDRGVDVWQYFMNSVIITFSTIALQLVVLIPAAYAFARFEFYGKNICFALVLLALMIPGQITYITVYLTMAKWKLLNTLLPQILPHAASAFGIFLLRQGFKQIPDEIVESAQLDSASQLQIVMRIMVPMCKSVILTIILFSFVGTWNNYFWPLVMTNSEEVRPLTILLIRVLDSEVGTRWNEIMACNLLIVLPVLLVYMFTSKRIIKAFVYNGIK